MCGRLPTQKDIFSRDHLHCRFPTAPPLERNLIDSSYLIFEQLTGEYYINGEHFKTDIKSQVFETPLDVLEPGENVVATPEETAVSISLKLTRDIENVELPPGRYRKYSLGSGKSPRQNSRFFSVKPTKVPVAESYKQATTRFLVASHNEVDWSRFKGVFYGSYDYDSTSYRLNSWIWCTGIVIEALLDRFQETRDQKLYDLAVNAGETLLEHQSPDGGYTVRWDYPRETTTGLKTWRAPNDSAFLASHGLLPLYDETGDKRYLDAATAVGNWVTEEALRDDGHLAFGDADGWDFSRLYVDAGFTTTLFERLYERDGAQRWVDACRSFVDWFVNHLYLSDEDRFIKTWEASGNHGTERYTRGQAWALDGLISAFELLSRDDLKEIIVSVARTLCDCQRDDGGWNNLMKNEYSGVDNKGTPIIAYHLARLGSIIGNEDFLRAASNGVHWCEANQVRQVSNGYGGIRAWNREGNIVGKRYATTAFPYASAYYLLAKDALP
jgi:rhamnogalacturonyl hydrolase YesR